MTECSEQGPSSHAALACYLGAGSFDLDNDLFRSYLSRQPLAAATQMEDAYDDRLQNQVMAAGNYDDLALAALAEMLAHCGDDKLQRRFTPEIAEYRAVVLAQQFHDFLSQAALNCDRNS